MPRFGLCLPIFALPSAGLFRTPGWTQVDAGAVLALGREADRLGYHSLWVADHLMLGRDEAILEGWTTLAALAGCTQRARLGLIHMAHPFRHPALVAKMTATLDQLSGGRLIHFVDCGRQRREYLAYGLPWSDDVDARIAAMVEGIELLLALWTGGPVERNGSYPLRGAVCTPPPLQHPHPPLWLGEPDAAILTATARYAQGWNSVPVGPMALAQRLAALQAACAAVGRPYDEIEKSLEIQVLMAPDHEALRHRLGELLALAPDRTAAAPDVLAFVAGTSDTLPPSLADTWLIGTPAEVQEQVAAYTAMGISHFLLWFVDAPQPGGLQLFAESFELERG